MGNKFTNTLADTWSQDVVGGTVMTLHIYNSFTSQKEKFESLKEGNVGMYVCGVTVYDMCHIGHARAYVTADVIYRHFRYLGLDVTYVRNFTDVDDKIIARANETNVSAEELSSKFIEEFHVDMDALNILRPDIEPRVTDHIPQIVELVQKLVNKGHAYVVDGDVYFDVGSYSAYGRLSKRNLDDMKAGARVDVDSRKKSPMDFALWKSSKPGEPMWESPWGEGRPGWHIECSAMSTKYLGETFDIHGGGKDLLFPHHENEVAQSEAASEKPLCKYFFHNGFVNIDKEKMSKSLGNFFTIREICEHYDPESLRYFLLTTHYRSPINFEVAFVCPECRALITREDVEQRKCTSCKREYSEKLAAQAIHFPSLEESQKRLDYLYSTKKRMDDCLKTGITGVGRIVRDDEISDLLPRFEESLDDDFNAAAALGVFSDCMKLVNDVLDNKENHPETIITSTIQRLHDVVGKMSSVLGILERDSEVALQSLQSRAMAETSLSPEEIDALVEERNQARADKNFQRADQIRDQLAEAGIELMDGPQGTTWKASG
jgi:cysteinyl-tRNA synthetase